MILRLSMVGALGLVLVGCDKPDLKADKGQYSYAIGAQIGRNIKEQNISLDIKSFTAGVKDAVDGKEMQLSEQDRMAALRKMSEGMREKESAAAGDNLKKGETYLAENKSKEGVKVTASGLQYKVITEGTGPKPKASDQVVVHYRGKLIDGKEFDSSYSRKEPAHFPVGAVIPGWTEALQLMNVGSKYDLVIPANLAYGERGNPSIPGNSVLLFEVELISIEKAGAAPAAPAHAEAKSKAKKK